ncbi:hypothetical protein F7725_025905 [Dissostichus mawsoni]|uniref:WxxW domain-containing protein n=1 Tax=Dissostichus mawsoni TaxID=36200 RepID=A0A7J5X5J2_DISMA|nr:hypothetical protein F7725_025905 [Dissostichus mawsoni]
MTCGWSEWINLGKPTSGPNGGDDESIHNYISAGYHICSAPEEVQSSHVRDGTNCDLTNKDVGFICNNKQQGPTQHTNYTLNTFHDSNICNTLNSFNHSNNYNTLNYIKHSTNYNTLYYFHHSNNCNTINSINNSYSLTTFEYNNYYTFYHNETTTPQPITTGPCPGGHDMTCGWSEWINLGNPTSGPMVEMMNQSII